MRVISIGDILTGTSQGRADRWYGVADTVGRKLLIVPVTRCPGSHPFKFRCPLRGESEINFRGYRPVENAEPAYVDELRVDLTYCFDVCDISSAP